MAEVQPVIEAHTATLTKKEADYLLTNFRNSLKIDLVRDIRTASGAEPYHWTAHTADIFDDVFLDNNNKDNE